MASLGHNELTHYVLNFSETKIKTKLHYLPFLAIAGNTQSTMTLYPLGNINSLRPEHNGRYFADYIFQYILLNVDLYILIKI